MPTAKEKSDFSARLRFALRKSAQTIKGATDLARLFNLKYRSNRSITVQTAHKWLSGRAIPTADKIDILAEWLSVNPNWLHYGPAPEPIPPKLKNALVDEAVRFAYYLIIFVPSDGICPQCDCV